MSAREMRQSSPEFSPEAEAAAHFRRLRGGDTSSRTQRKTEEVERRIRNAAADAAWRAWPDRPDNPYSPRCHEHEIWENSVRGSREWRQVHIEEGWYVVVDGVEFCDLPTLQATAPEQEGE